MICLKKTFQKGKKDARVASLMVKRGSKHDRVICNLDNGSTGKKRHKPRIETLFRLKGKTTQTSLNMAANYHIIWSFSLMISFVFTFSHLFWDCWTSRMENEQEKVSSSDDCITWKNCYDKVLCQRLLFLTKWYCFQLFQQKDE